MNRQYRHRLLGLGILIWAGLLVVGCGSSGGLVAVGGGIVLSASPTVIEADGKSASVITATVTSTGGTPSPIGTQVTFTTNLGRFSNGSTVYTIPIGNSSGTVTVTLISGTVEGTATVTCSAGGASQTIQIYIGNVAITTIRLSASPTSLNAGGVESSTITAMVTDSQGNPAISGTPVTFRTTLGFFSNKQTTYTTQTGSNGVATAILFAGDTVGKAEITCTAGEVSAVVYVEIKYNPNPSPGEVANINVTASTLSILADGISSTTIQAVLTDRNGTPVVAGTPVSFTTSLGSFANGSKTYETTTASTEGSARAVLFAGTTPGTAKVTVSSGGVSGMIYIEFRSF